MSFRIWFIEMSKRETKFNASWCEKYGWNSKGKNCIHSVWCTLCSESFSIRTCCISDVNQHSKTAIHLKNEKQMRSHRMFKTRTGSLTLCSKPTKKNQILNVEIWQALNVVDKNHSFSSATGSKNVLGLANCCEIFSRGNKIQICCSIWSRSLC